MLLSNLSGTTLPSVTQLPATPIMPVTGSSPEGHDSIVPLFKYIKLNPGSNLTCSEAPPDQANATYLYGVDNRTCTTTMTSAHPIVLTGRYSGCILTVSEISEEEYCVAHVYNGGSNPGLIEDTKKYLKAIKAKKTTAVRSAGAMKGTVGADSVWFIVELVSPGTVGVSRVVANKTGRVIKEQSAVIMPPGNVQDLLQYTEQW